MIHIVCCTDENYAFNFPVIVQSIMEHHGKEEVVFHMVHSALTSITLEKIDQYVSQKGITVSRYLLDDSIFASLPETGYITIAMYFRLMIPEILPGSIDKVLYLDMDVIVDGRLDELWNQNLDGKGAAVVAEGLAPHLGEYSPKQYFNSGVMLMNLNYWRECNVKDDAINFMLRHMEVLRYPDQDALNVVLQHNLRFVPEKWNYHVTFDKRFLKRALKGEVEQSLAPVIVHFNQSMKPWMYHCKHPYRRRYWNLLKQTTFRDYHMKNKTLAAVLFYFTPKPLRTTLWPKLALTLPQN